MKRIASLALASLLILSIAMSGQASASSSEAQAGPAREGIQAEHAGGMLTGRPVLPQQSARFATGKNRNKEGAEAILDACTAASPLAAAGLVAAGTGHASTAAGACMLWTWLKD